ncbi:MAG: DUF1501 domain-containing protein [Planctomycetia bacterium]|nr:DUF1501 domain-containing protein [Planctomycetia bacterium]
MNFHPRCTGVNRRSFLADMGMGFTGLALGSMLFQDGVARADHARPDGKPHFAPKAKSVIWLFMVGGTSQMESFDPKPELNKHAGKTIQESPYKATLESPYLKENLREVIPGLHKVHPKIYPMQITHQKYGQAGIEVSDWYPHVGSCIDDIAVVRSLWTTDNNHGAQLQFHTGRHSLEGAQPTIGSWIHYGLGALNENLPQFVVLGTPLADCCGGAHGHGAHYLGPQHDGVRMNVDPKNPLPFATPGADKFREEQQGEFDLLGKLNRLAGIEYPSDPAMQARIKSYELAFRMQTAVPEVFQLDKESPEIQKLYGLDQGNTKTFGQQCLSARRLVERGVRFVQIFHGSNGGAGAWDAHGGLKNGHSSLCGQTDKPIAGLLKDLKQRGLLKDTLVVWCTEFGRTPGAQGSDGRDHHPYGFSAWLAGGGIKGGVVHGATDELGFHAVEHRHYVTDLHATVLQQLGLDPRKLEVPGRKRLEIDFGKPIREIIA